MDNNNFKSYYASDGALMWGGYFPDDSIMGAGGDTDDFTNSRKSSNFVITKKAIQDVISGKSEVSNGEAIHAAASYIRGGTSASSEAKGSKLFKEQEKERIKTYATENSLWIPASYFINYLSEGAEQKVYFVDGISVIKINDAIFYNSWEDYFHSLLLHNYFFPDTAYELIGFTEKDGDLYSVVRQPFISDAENADLESVKKIMVDNGFVNTRKDDYYNPELGVIIEDLHDENVLSKDGILYFVDTVFYLKDEKNISGSGVMAKGGKAGIPERYKKMGFSKVGQKKKSTRPEKKWMVLAKKGDKYKVVHGGQKGMEDFSQHRDKKRQRRFWERMGGFDSEKANDPFSPLYWHKKFGTWAKGGVLDKGTIKVAWIDSDAQDIMESKMFDSVEEALKYSEGKTFLIFELEDSHDDYYKWQILPYGMYDKYKMALDWADKLTFEKGGMSGRDNIIQSAGEKIMNNPDNKLEKLYQNLYRVKFSVPTILSIQKFKTKLVPAYEGSLSGTKRWLRKWGVNIYDPHKEQKYKATSREYDEKTKNVFEFEITGSKKFENKREMMKFLETMNVSPFVWEKLKHPN